MYRVNSSTLYLPHDIVSYRIVSYRIVSYRIVSYRVVLYHITLCYNMHSIAHWLCRIGLLPQVRYIHNMQSLSWMTHIPKCLVQYQRLLMKCIMSCIPNCFNMDLWFLLCNVVSSDNDSIWRGEMNKQINWFDDMLKMVDVSRDK